MSPQRVVMLDNIRSAHNVGSIFRTCDGAGVEKLYLIGTTPTPVDRFGRVQPEIAKTSLGATESVAWEQIGSAESLSTQTAVAEIESLKQAGYAIVAVEQTPQSVSLTSWQQPQKVCFIFGTERGGLQPELLQIADHIIDIPMHGQKDSLNVSVSVGVVLYQSLR
ncbi:MAG: TrmH family RNA methyltransferase [Candidatus Paceibacterota bacterium]